MQTNRFNIILLILFIYSNSFSQKKVENDNTNPSVINDTIQANVLEKNLKEKDEIQHVIEHTANDYILEDVPNKKVTLYNKAHVVYDKYDIQSGKILIDYKNNTIKAVGIFNEKKKYTQLPIFKNEKQETQQDSLVFNYRTKKAIIYGLTSKEDGLNTLGRITKKINDSVIFSQNIIFTTSDLKNPDYYISNQKAKIIVGKKLITKNTHLVLADVPTPIYTPFAFFPLSKNRTSGIIFPTYGKSDYQGFFLQNGGYYLVINDYLDLKLTGDFYTNNSWGIKTYSNYKVRYKFNGNLNFNYDNLITDIEGFSNYSVAKNFNLKWSHNQDPKSSPYTRFSASVNLGSSQYFRKSINELTRPQTLTNTLSSSISYFKKIVDTPISVNISANHRQNTNTKMVSLSLPSFQFNLDRQYPFALKNDQKKNIFQKIGLDYTLLTENKLEISEKEIFTKQFFGKLKNGSQQNINLNTNAKLLKHFSLSPMLNYKEIWYLHTIKKRYDEKEKKIITDRISGFDAFREYNASISLSTTFYGLVRFKKTSIKAIRHTVRPSISFNYKPDFSFYYDSVKSDDSNEKFQTYSKFDDGIYGKPSKDMQKIMNFNLSNTFEAKVLDSKSLEEKTKKITLLNALNLNCNYNFVAKKFKLSILKISLNTQLFKVVNLDFRVYFDPYHFENKKRIDVFSYLKNGPLLRLTDINFTKSFKLSSREIFKKKEEKKTSLETSESNISHSDDKNDSKKLNLPQYVSTIHWDLNISYVLKYSNIHDQNKIDSHSLTFSGDIELSPGWKVGVSSGYDFANKGFTFTTLNFSRDLRSWKMNFEWSPIGHNSSYYFFIGVKAPILKDLKWEKRSVDMNS